MDQFTPHCGVPPQGPWPAAEHALSADDPPAFAIGLPEDCRLEHAVPWAAALPGRTTTTACGMPARVPLVAGVPVLWPLHPATTCEACAAAVAGSRPGP
jgi:hypothetical protein